MNKVLIFVLLSVSGIFSQTFQMEAWYYKEFQNETGFTTNYNHENLIKWNPGDVGSTIEIRPIDTFYLPFELFGYEDEVSQMQLDMMREWNDHTCLTMIIEEYPGNIKIEFKWDEEYFGEGVEAVGVTGLPVDEIYDYNLQRDVYYFDEYSGTNILLDQAGFTFTDGHIYLNDTFNREFEYTASYSQDNNKYILATILLHELGHVLGFGHNGYVAGVDNIMANGFTVEQFQTVKPVLSYWDKGGIAEYCEAVYDITVGVNDYLNINELTATELLREDISYSYEAVFVDADNSGTTFDDFNWEINLSHSSGYYTLGTSSLGVYDCLPDGYNWDVVDGKIQGEVICYGYDSDGTYQEDTFSIEAEVASTCEVAPVISHFTQTPLPICQGSSGYVYVHLEQGSGSLNYNWQVINLPPGAYITPLGNKCRITYPTTASTSIKHANVIMAPTNVVRCTVSNSAGSDTDDTNVSMSSTCDPSGCPTLAFNSGGERADENTLLISSLSKPGEDVTDYYLINTEDKLHNGNIEFTIHEPSEEHTWFDEIELWEVKANHGEFIAVTDEGNFINFKETKRPLKYTLNENIDITAELEANDGSTYFFLPGDLLRIERAKGKVSPSTQSSSTIYAAAIGVKPPGSAKISAGDLFVNQSSGKGNKTSGETYGLGSLYFRDKISTVAKKIGDLDEEAAVEIVFNNETEIDYFVLTKNLKTVKAKKLELISSEKDGRSLDNNFSSRDGNYAELLPGEEIKFKYKTKTKIEKQTKIKHVLKVVGRYEKADGAGIIAGKEGSDGITSVEEELPKENKLYANYPNPFNPTTIIKYELKEPANVTLKVFDSLGRIVNILASSSKPAGRYEIEFDGSNLSSGLYFYQLTSDKFNFTNKMLLVK